MQVNMNVESMVSMSLDKLSDDATEDLRDMVDKVDQNMAMKERLRVVQRQLELYKEAVRNGDGAAAAEHRDNMQEELTTMGLTFDNSSEGTMVTTLPAGRAVQGPPPPVPQEELWQMDPSERQWHRARQGSGVSQEDRDEMLSGVIKSFETLLDHRGQSLSDLGQRLQFYLQEKNNIFSRANKAQSDISAKYDQSLNGMSQNLKG